jgi:hypothetical protein
MRALLIAGWFFLMMGAVITLMSLGCLMCGMTVP